MDKIDDKEVNQNRRRALFGTATGAALVAAWHKPIVNAVVSPAHAQMSEPEPEPEEEDEFGIDNGTTFISLNRRQVGNESQQNFSPLDLFISPAHAGEGPPGSDGDVKVTYNGNGMFDYEHINRNGTVKRTGMVAVGEINEVDVVEDCRRREGEPGQHSIEVLEASADEVTLRITSDSDSGETTYMLDPGDEMLETDCDDIIDDNGQNQGNTNGQMNGQVNGQVNGQGNGNGQNGQGPV